jgi:O-antigen ligase
MIQGQGIIDVVNSYLGIALEYGLLGLGLFVAFFLSLLWGIYGVLRRFRTLQIETFMFGVKRYVDNPSVREDERYILGVTLLAVLIAILITIYTVSSIIVIPMVYWAVAGMGAAYIQMQDRNQT